MLLPNPEITKAKQRHTSYCVGIPVRETCTDGVVPKVHAAVKIPSALRDKLKAELDKMEKDACHQEETLLTQYVNSMVAVPTKDGTLRLCIDPVDLNESIRRPNYPIPKLEASTSNLHGAKYFTKLDLRSRYWLLSLDEESSDLTTFNTIFGRYR
ncbi:hypothetical protein QYM36_005113 [Artemia franciscana]|uniref:Reverse transcriptase n=1 Tax=Artemia franciscana TaxID=6661 RepID=A0AA88I729_ARTSF|nr:hypothetical protein QYM36_005113 [Artemia franciscana]